MMQKRIDELENKLAETERMHDLLKETNALMDGEENNVIMLAIFCTFVWLLYFTEIEPYL